MAIQHDILPQETRPLAYTRQRRDRGRVEDRGLESRGYKRRAEYTGEEEPRIQ